jgi:hypothetical protein
MFFGAAPTIAVSNSMSPSFFAERSTAIPLGDILAGAPSHPVALVFLLSVADEIEGGGGPSPARMAQGRGGRRSAN